MGTLSREKCEQILRKLCEIYCYQNGLKLEHFEIHEKSEKQEEVKE